jgi:enoyl-CoA hydratase/carnithine racemase
MDWETMRLVGEGAVQHLVLNRPQVHNAINRQFLFDLVQACLYIETLPDCRVVIVSGEGPSFCSGADVKEALTHKGAIGQMMSRSKAGARAMQAVAEMTPISIAAVHGHAIGGGAMLAMACDFRVAATTAKLSIREISLGISLSWQTIPNVVNLVGPARAKEMIIFGDTYDARKMLDYGVYYEAVEPERLMAAAESLAQRVVKQPPLPVSLTKASIDAYVRALDRAVFHADPVGLAMTGRTQDAVQAKDAFFQRGPTLPWTGE